MRLTRQVLKKDLKRLPIEKMTVTDIPYLLPIVQDERFYPALLQLPEICLSFLIEEIAIKASAQDMPELLDIAGRLLSEQKGMSLVYAVKNRELLALYRYYAFGEYDGTKEP